MDYHSILKRLNDCSDEKSFYNYLDLLSDVSSPDNPRDLLVFSSDTTELYIGTAMCDYSQYQCIFNMSKEVDKKISDFLTYYKTPLDDVGILEDKSEAISDIEKILPFIYREFTFAEEGGEGEEGVVGEKRPTKRKIIIHCTAGRSRSVTTIISFLHKYYHKSPLEILNFLGEHNWYVGPNVLFCKYIAKLQFSKEILRKI